METANTAFDKFGDGKNRAAHIKREFDIHYNPTWHCVLGTNFGSYVRCE